MHPNPKKYAEASKIIHRIWADYTDLINYVALDECFMDVTDSVHLFGGARNIADEIKKRVFTDTALTCSVGIGYSIMSAKLASEAKKPDGLFELPTPETLKNYIYDRSVRVIYGIGAKTAERLQQYGINTVRDIDNNREKVLSLLGNHGKDILDLVDGVDNRPAEPNSDAKSLGTERTFQQDITDRDFLKDALRLIAKTLSFQIRNKGTFCRTITLKVKFANMQQITRTKSVEPTNKADIIYETSAELFDKVEKRPIRLIGITLSNFSQTVAEQLDFGDIDSSAATESKKKLDTAMLDLQRNYGSGIIKTASELNAENRFKED